MRTIAAWLFGLLLLGFNLPALAQAESFADTVKPAPVQTIKFLPFYFLMYDAPQLRLAYERGTEDASWQLELGYVVGIENAEMDDYDRTDMRRGFAVQIQRRWAISPGMSWYLAAAGEYRYVTARMVDWVGKECEGGGCAYYQREEWRNPVHSPTVHVFIGKAIKPKRSKIRFDIEGGLGYKWAYFPEQVDPDFFFFDLVGTEGDWRRKINLRLNIAFGREI